MDTIVEEDDNHSIGRPRSDFIEALVDSGASGHSTGNPRLIEKIVNSKEVNMSMTVVGEGKLKITEKGELGAKVNDKEGDQTTLHLSNLHVVRGMGEVTLISNLELARNGYRTVLDLVDSYLENKITGERIPMKLKEDGWYLDLNVEENISSRYNIFGEKNNPILSCSSLPDDCAYIKWDEVKQELEGDLPEKFKDIVTWANDAQIAAR